MSLVTDPKDSRIKRGGVDTHPVEQNEVYLVLSEEERKKGFIRPVRTKYRHVGIDGPRNPLADLSEDEKKRYAQFGYVKFEKYPKSESPLTGRYWTQKQLDSIRRGCGTITTMALEIAETYARNPQFYGSTYCVGCKKHLAVGPQGEFEWLDGSKVGV
jgi:hypothetical protein